jgi:hypothetical protein
MKTVSSRWHYVYTVSNSISPFYVLMKLCVHCFQHNFSPLYVLSMKQQNKTMHCDGLFHSSTNECLVPFMCHLENNKMK